MGIGGGGCEYDGLMDCGNEVECGYENGTSIGLNNALLRIKRCALSKTRCTVDYACKSSHIEDIVAEVGRADLILMNEKSKHNFYSPFSRFIP